MPATPVMVSEEKVATPLEMVAVEPAVMAPPVPVLIVAVMVPEALVTTLPPESSTLTTGWPARAEPFVAPEGWVVTASWVAAPVETVMLVEAAGKPSPVKVRV